MRPLLSTGRVLRGGATALAFLLILAPILVVVVAAFSPTDYFEFPPPGLSLRWFFEFFRLDNMRGAFVLSLELALLSATIATDKTLDKTVNMTVYPRALPSFLSVDMPRTDNPAQNWHFTGFMMDQDTGGAIRASGRCDIYMGIGPSAEQSAGHQLSEGELYYIAVK